MDKKEASTGKKIIIVDDNPADALFAMRIIKTHRAEYEVIFMDEGNQLLEYLNTESSTLPAVILLDRHMPAMNGIEVLHKIKRIGRANAVPVIMLSSSRYELDITESYRLGVSGYIVKPLDEQKFLNCLDNLPDSVATANNG